MDATTLGGHEGDDRHAALLNNAAAIRAVCSAVEGTLGPKGLDTMLVGGQGDVLITNDGVTILEKMDVSHPAARLLVQVARSQQSEVGDGTTTATVLAGAMVAEGAAMVIKGVPVAKVVAGIEEGTRIAAEYLTAIAHPIDGLDDPMLYQIAYIAGREHADLAQLVLQGARLIGWQRLADESFRFPDAVTALDKGQNEVYPGLFLARKPAAGFFDREEASGTGVLILMDALEPEKPADEALVTEAGFREYTASRERFRSELERLAELGIGLIAADRGVDAEAEQFCADRGIMVLPRLPRHDLLRLREFTGAVPLRRAALAKPAAELARALGRCRAVYDAPLGRVRISDGGGRSAVAVAVGGSTRELAGERTRIAADAAAAVQAAVRGGYVAGGGAAELAAARELERCRETVKGLEGFGIAVVAEALRRPLAQIVVNAGFNPLEKVEQAKAAGALGDSTSIAIDCDTGELIDMIQHHIIDPLTVKLHAVQTAGEVAAAVLRIRTVIKMRQDSEPSSH
ncbi:MAG: TCP-1/cpn60 chaperonin family protein [Gorillibacterium sp.]|nr:TCP-1/cpn60 chaperonin family protein [Gorillibacterium sp.]